VSIEGVAPSRIAVIHNGIDVVRIEKSATADLPAEYGSIHSDDKVVGIVANYNRTVKRLDLFIKAAAMVKERRDKVKFLIIGGGKLDNELRSLSESLGVGDQVVFCGKKEDPIPYIRHFDIGVMASDSEGFSNTILEYMAAGIAVVATNVGGNNELIDDGLTGVLVPSGDPQALATAICQLLENEEYRVKLGQQAARVVSERYDWGAKVKELEDYYTALVRRGRG
jgi:glycosyltransferase involved in cell wall biosynthesis